MSTGNIEALDRLAAQFTKLPGVGAKTARRFAYKIINMSEQEAKEFADAVLETKKTVHFCPVCGAYTDKDVCDICSTRDKSVICVVKEPRDITALEKVKGYDGVYHVLFGLISPLENKAPNDIRIKELLRRINELGTQEVIMATDPDVEGDATAMYIAKLLKPMGIKVTRLAQGISTGSDLEYADEITLSKAMEGRVEI